MYFTNKTFLSCVWGFPCIFNDQWNPGASVGITASRPFLITKRMRVQNISTRFSSFFKLTFSAPVERHHELGLETDGSIMVTGFLPRASYSAPVLGRTFTAATELELVPTSSFKTTTSQGTYTFPHRPGWKACRSGTACWHRGRNTGFPVLPSRSPPSPFPAQDVVNLAAGPQLWHSGDHTFLHEQQGLMGLLLHSQERAQADNVGLCQS